MSTTKPLTTADLVALAEIASAAQQSAKVTYLSENGDIVKGTARSFVVDPARPVFLSHNDDVRDAYLWITLDSGFETFPSVRHLMRLVFEGGFVLGDV
jgi:hypothetical protein